MKNERRVWQHVIEDVSENQLSELIHSKLEWVVERLGRDYGEDLHVRIFENGKPTGNDFYIQLKGTRDIEQYALKTKPYFSYGISISNLSQWKDFTLPVIIVLWDIEQRCGFWVHAQCLIKNKLQRNQDWLQNANKTTESKRQIHIPQESILDQDNIQNLKDTIDKEYKKTKLGRRYFEKIHREKTEIFKNALIPQRQAKFINKNSVSLPPSVEQHLQITQYIAATYANPTDIDAWLNLARIYYETNELEKTLDAINRAWALNRDNPQIINARACTLAEYAMAKDGQKAMLHEAITLFSLVEKDVEMTGMTSYNIGNCYAGLGEHTKAIEYYDKALIDNPSSSLSSQIWTNRGKAFHHLDNYSAAISSYENALTKNPQQWEAYLNWAYSEIKHGNFVEAQKLLETIPEQDEKNFALIYALAYTLWQLGELPESYRRVNQILEIKPEYKDAKLLKFHLLSELWRLEPLYISSAEKFLKSVILEDSNNVDAKIQLHLLCNHEYFIDETNWLINQSDLDSVPVNILYRSATVLDSERNLGEALRYMEAAYKRNQEHHVVHLLAQLYQETGNYEDAIEFYNLALVGVEDAYSILIAIADCYYWLEDYTGCVLTISKLILLDSNNSDLRRNLVYALSKLGISHMQIDIYSNFLEEKLHENDYVTDEELREKIYKLI